MVATPTNATIRPAGTTGVTASRPWSAVPHLLCIVAFLALSACALRGGSRPSPVRITFDHFAYRESAYEPPFPVAVFSVANGGGEALAYSGSSPDALGFPLGQEYVDGEWRTPRIAVCGYGITECSWPPGKGFMVDLRVREEAEAVRLHIHAWRQRDESPASAFSDPVAVRGHLPPPPAIVIPADTHARQAGLVHAARIGDRRKVRALLAAGVAVDARPGTADGVLVPYSGGGWSFAERNWTALHAAAAGGDAAIVTLLLAAGAAKDADDGCGATPLLYACERADGDAAATALLAAGANPSATIRLPDCLENRGGLSWQPIHGAAEHGRVQLVRALLAAGADANARNGQDESPWDLTDDAGTRQALAAAGGTHGDAPTIAQARAALASMLTDPGLDDSVDLVALKAARTDLLADGSYRIGAWQVDVVRKTFTHPTTWNTVESGRFERLGPGRWRAYVGMTESR